MSLVKELEQLQVKANKYDNIQGRYVEHAKELDKIISLCIELKKKIDPVAGTSTRKGKKSGKGDIKEIADEFHQLILHGSEVSRPIIQASHPELDDGQLGYVLTQLKARKGVSQRKEGIKSILYAQKDI